jgi:zinc transport system permease protein
MLSVFSVIIGFLVSFYASMPNGATIVVVALVMFVVSLVSKKGLGV